jgi:hypothetical protein
VTTNQIRGIRGHGWATFLAFIEVTGDHSRALRRSPCIH